MFIGHFGLGFGAKKISPRPSLGTLFLAAQFIDLLWPFFLLAGIEKVAIDPGNTVSTPLNFISYPYSHSLVAVLAWSLLFGMVYYLVKKNIRSAFILGLLVLSHWILDLLVHRPDLPLSFSENSKLGLGLWNHKLLSMAIELLIFAAGVFFYMTSTVHKNKAGRYGTWGLILFFILLFFANGFGDPPPSVEAIKFIGLAQWLFVLWAYWVDRNRQPVLNGKAV